MNPTLSMNPLRVAAILTGIVLLAGCAASAPRDHERKQAVFYPEEPDPPRIQHLATFERVKDLGGPKSGLADFVLGDERPGEALARPYGAQLFQGKIVVADSKAPGLAVFDLVAKRYSLFDGGPGGRMQRPINVSIDADGTRYVTDTGRNQVLVYGPNDRYVTAFGEKGDYKPVGTAIAGDRLYVVDIEHHDIRVLDKRTGKQQSRFGKPGSQEGELFQPTNIAIGPEGDLYIVETGNFRVSRFTPDGKFVRRYGEAGQTPGRFARPKGIAVDRAGRLYVGDAAFQNVQVFANDGQVLMTFGQPPGGAQGLNLPAGISIDYAGAALFKDYAAPGFAVEYVILVVSQFGPNKVDVFGFGKMQGVAYPPDDKPAAKPGG